MVRRIIRGFIIGLLTVSMLIQPDLSKGFSIPTQTGPVHFQAPPWSAQALAADSLWGHQILLPINSAAFRIRHSDMLEEMTIAERVAGVWLISVIGTAIVIKIHSGTSFELGSLIASGVLALWVVGAAFEMGDFYKGIRGPISGLAQESSWEAGKARLKALSLRHGPEEKSQERFWKVVLSLSLSMKHADDTIRRRAADLLLELALRDREWLIQTGNRQLPAVVTVFLAVLEFTMPWGQAAQDSMDLMQELWGVQAARESQRPHALQEVVAFARVWLHQALSELNSETMKEAIRGPLTLLLQNPSLFHALSSEDQPLLLHLMGLTVPAATDEKITEKKAETYYLIRFGDAPDWSLEQGSRLLTGHVEEIASVLAEMKPRLSHKERLDAAYELFVLLHGEKALAIKKHQGPLKAGQRVQWGSFEGVIMRLKPNIFRNDVEVTLATQNPTPRSITYQLQALLNQGYISAASHASTRHLFFPAVPASRGIQSAT